MGRVGYIGSCSGVYYAFDVISGTVQWRHDFKSDLGQATFHGDPLVTDRVVITPTEALQPTHTRAFDRYTGRTVWQQSGEWALTHSDAVGLGPLVVGRNEDGALIALNAHSGTPIWRAFHQRRRFPTEDNESPAVIGSDVVYSAPDGAVYRVSGATGKVLWRTEVACDVSTSVTAEEDDLYLGCRTGTLFRLVAVNGAERARIALGHPLEGRLLVAGDRLIVPGGRAWIGAVPRDLSRVLWERQDLSPLSVVQPMRWGQAVLTGSPGRLIALQLADGRTAWTTLLDGTVRGLGTADDIVLVGTVEGTLYALRGLPKSLRERPGGVSQTTPH